MTTLPAAVSDRRAHSPTHMPSHLVLTHDSSHTRVPTVSGTAGRFDAIVVPASRGADALDGAARLAARLGVPLVALCSLKTSAGEAAARLSRVRGCRALAVDVPATYQHPWLPRRTAALRFRVARADRRSDLSLKRNLGLLMARLHGWGKVLFLDDDIGDVAGGVRIALPVVTARKLAAELDNRQVVGMTCREFPDNSVVCHARRLAGYRQDTFVSGSALGVNTYDQPVPFFPDQYNEDWFFFSPLVAERRLGLAGTATQAPYDPYANPRRAREEEFGDLLAEGLFTLFEGQPAEMSYFARLASADERYWERYIDQRREMLDLTRLSLESAIEYALDADRCAAALGSVDAAHDQLGRLSARICTDYVDAWADDLRDWEWSTQRIRPVGVTGGVLDALGLPNWRLVGRTSYLRSRVLTGRAA